MFSSEYVQQNNDAFGLKRTVTCCHFSVLQAVIFIEFYY